MSGGILFCSDSSAIALSGAVVFSVKRISPPLNIAHNKAKRGRERDAFAGVSVW